MSTDSRVSGVPLSMGRGGATSGGSSSTPQCSQWTEVCQGTSSRQRWERAPCAPEFMILSLRRLRSFKRASHRWGFLCRFSRSHPKLDADLVAYAASSHISQCGWQRATLSANEVMVKRTGLGWLRDVMTDPSSRRLEFGRTRAKLYCNADRRLPAGAVSVFESTLFRLRTRVDYSRLAKIPALSVGRLTEQLSTSVRLSSELLVENGSAYISVIVEQFSP